MTTSSNCKKFICPRSGYFNLILHAYRVQVSEADWPNRGTGRENGVVNTSTVALAIVRGLSKSPCACCTDRERNVEWMSKVQVKM